MLDFIINNINFLVNFPTQSDCNLLGADFRDILTKVFSWIQIATPCLVIALCSVDMVQAVISQEEKDMKTALTRTVKRIVIGVAIFFVPVVLNFILYMAGLTSGVCKIGL